MAEERRRAARAVLAEAIETTVNDVPVRVLELSAIGARLEHEQRFPLSEPRLRLRWEGETVNVPMRVVRSQIVGQREAKLVYETGVTFEDAGADAERVIAGITGDVAAPATVEPSVPAKRAEAPPRPVLDDSWTRAVQFLKSDVGDDLPYAQFRLRDSRWTKEYVATPEQPEDGFTIPSSQTDFAELQRTFECADPETRRMMRIALQSQLGRSG